MIENNIAFNTQIGAVLINNNPAEKIMYNNVQIWPVISPYVPDPPYIPGVPYIPGTHAENQYVEMNKVPDNETVNYNTSIYYLLRLTDDGRYWDYTAPDAYYKVRELPYYYDITSGSDVYQYGNINPQDIIQRPDPYHEYSGLYLAYFNVVLTDECIDKINTHRPYLIRIYYREYHLSVINKSFFEWTSPTIGSLSNTLQERVLHAPGQSYWQGYNSAEILDIKGSDEYEKLRQTTIHTNYPFKQYIINNNYKLYSYDQTKKYIDEDTLQVINEMSIRVITTIKAPNNIVWKCDNTGFLPLDYSNEKTHTLELNNIVSYALQHFGSRIHFDTANRDLFKILPEVISEYTAQQLNEHNSYYAFNLMDARKLEGDITFEDMNFMVYCSSQTYECVNCSLQGQTPELELTKNKIYSLA